MGKSLLVIYLKTSLWKIVSQATLIPFSFPQRETNKRIEKQILLSYGLFVKFSCPKMLLNL